MGYTLVQKGEETDKSQLFTMGQVTKATGLSRSTVMRMENRGLLKPAYISPASGHRYYDVYNVMNILSVQRLLEMGFTYEEVRQYFSAGADATQLFAIVERRLRMFQHTYEEMKLRATTDKHMSVQLCQMPEMWYYVERARGHSIQDKYNMAYAAYHHCMEKGYRPSDGPPMSLNYRTDYLDGYIDTHPYDFDVCIAVHPGQKGPEVVVFPACSALVLYYCGDFSELDEAYLLMGREVRDRGLESAGFIRGDTVAGPPLGRDVGLDKYRCRLILPVKEEGQRL